MVGGTREKGVLCVCVRVCFCVCAEECKAATCCIKMQTQMMYFPLGIRRVRVFIHLSVCVCARVCVRAGVCMQRLWGGGFVYGRI